MTVLCMTCGPHLAVVDAPVVVGVGLVDHRRDLLRREVDADGVLDDVDGEVAAPLRVELVEDLPAQPAGCDRYNGRITVM